MTHTHKIIPHQRLIKPKRLRFRIVVSIIIICLPLAHLNSLQLVSTTTGLVCAVLLFELIGASCAGDNILWDKQCCRNKARYDAKLSVGKEELERSMTQGTVLNVEDLAKREAGEKGVLGHV